MVIDIAAHRSILPIFLPLMIALEIQRQVLNFWFPVDAQVYLFKKRTA